MQHHRPQPHPGPVIAREHEFVDFFLHWKGILYMVCLECIQLF